MRSPDAFAIGRLDAHDQAALVARGECSPAELVEAAIARIDSLDPALNAISHRADDHARAAALTARGAMAGVPWLVKEGMDYPGMPTRSGSRAYADAPAATAIHPYAAVLDDAGLVAIGKTSAPEFGLLPTTEPLLYGPARNPWAPDRSPGGSSGGAAVAVASGMVPLAHAADGGGSIRIPASCCGLVGLKPGRAANLRARDPHVIEDLLVADALLSRSVRDVAWAASQGSPMPFAVDDRTGPLRIAVVSDSLDGIAPDPVVAANLDRAAALCSSLGHRVERVVQPVDGPAVAAAFRTIWGYLAREASGGALARGATRDQLEPWTLALADWAQGIAAADTDALYTQVAATGRALAGFFQRWDVILSPVLRRATLSIGTLAPTRPFDEMMTTMFDYVGYTPLHNLSGTPAISLPLFEGDDGVPIGSMFAGPRGGEGRLLALAADLERAVPWAARWPAHSVAPA